MLGITHFTDLLSWDYARRLRSPRFLSYPLLRIASLQ